MNRCEKLTKDFKTLADKNRLSHAYLFFGESENEKIDFAESLANYLENNAFEKPKKLLEETLIISPDEKDNIGIDRIRELSKFLYQKPVFSKKRIVIVSNGEKMSPEAQNATLKIVEESPNQSLIIFIAKNDDLLLPPLLSRLQKIYFPENIKNSEKNNGLKNFSPKLPLSKKEIDEIVENDQIDELFKSLIIHFQKDPIKNHKQLKEIFKRLTFFKKYNINKKLQLKCLSSL